MNKYKLLIALLFFCSPLLAQPGDPGDGGDPDVPISGIEVLIGAGALLGAKKMYAKRKASQLKK